jgi:D-sedoheptulose 7-phosphate isomerase
MNTHLDTLRKRHPATEICNEAINAAYELLRDTFSGGRKLLICGNGGSCADSDHIAGELMKGFIKKRPVSAAFRETLVAAGADPSVAGGLQEGLPAIALTTHGALMTAVANDNDPTAIFAQQVMALGQPGDVLMALSTSGNSRNVVLAAQVAKARGLKTISLTGASGGKLKALCDVAICAPATVTPEVQEFHLPIYHALCLMIEDHFFAE